MPTLITHLTGEDHEMLKAMAMSMYLDGECYAFAIAIHRETEWPLVGLMDSDTIRHAAVWTPTGGVFDVRGYVSEENFGEPFGIRRPYKLREIVEGDLHRTRKIEDGSIQRAKELAEMLWPELPWKTSRAKRAVAFADELEALCRKHRLWIRGPVPAGAPMLAEGYDDEGGYALSPTMDGVTFTINRYLKP